MLVRAGWGVGHESLTTTHHGSSPELLPLEPSRLETRSEESCLLGDSWLGVGQTAGWVPLTYRVE